MPTILELFKNQPYQSFGNKTAEEVFEVRNSKDIQITSTNAILNNTSFKIIKLARRNLSSRLKETRVEEEVTGVRVIRGLSEPVLYGTEYGRILKRSTNILNSMKNDAVGGNEQDNGILGNFLNKVEEKGTNLLNRLGVELPENLIPTKIKLNDDFIKGTVSELPQTLAKIKKDGAGNVLGNFLAKGVSGTPNQIGNQLLGNAIGTAKDAVRKKLFGSRKQGGVNLASATSIQYNEVTKYSDTIDATNEDVPQRNDLTSVYDEALRLLGNIPPGGIVPQTSLQKVEKVKYSESEEARISTELSSENTPNTFLYSNSGNVLGTRTEFNKIGFDTKSDFLNEKDTYSSTDGSNQKLKDGTFLDDYDFVALKFWSFYKKTAVNFRATINGLSENLSPSWQSQKTIGNPFSFHTYEGIERSVTFSFKIYSLTSEEHKNAWSRLNFLTSLVYPSSLQTAALYATPPFLKFTLGDMYVGKECFIESLSYTIDDNTPWDIDTPGYILPTIIDASVTLKFVESSGSTFKVEISKNSDGKDTAVLKSNRLYGYGNVPPSVETDEQKGKDLNADSSAKSKETTVQTKQVADGNSEKKVENPVTSTPTNNKLSDGLIKYKFTVTDFREITNGGDYFLGSVSVESSPNGITGTIFEKTYSTITYNFKNEVETELKLQAATRGFYSNVNRTDVPKGTFFMPNLMYKEVKLTPPPGISLSLPQIKQIETAKTNKEKRQERRNNRRNN
jgi:hypothetical protein